MIERIIDWSARNRFLVLLVVGAAAVYGWHSLQRIPLDAIPDLSDTQVIVYSRWDRSPDIMEDQVTYPIVSALLGAPRVKDIRGFSDFGFSFVYVIFEDGTDIYWARSRVLEYLSAIQPNLPPGVSTELGPDATGVGWVYQYALTDKSGKHDLAEMRSFQDWYLRYYLQSVEGVAEVAAFGGFVKQYQITVDPNRLAAYGLSISGISDAVRASNNEIGGKLVELGETEFMVRARGYLRGVADIEQIVVAVNERGTPVLMRDVANVGAGPEMRRGAGDLDGEGDVVGGIVVMRHGENALKVIERVKTKIGDLRRQGAFPEGVELVETYDRSTLIKESIATLRRTLVVEMAVVTAVILLFLLHIPSSLIPIVTLPVAVLLAFIPMYHMGVGSNIMSLGGIAVAIGALVDAAIVVVENVHKKIDRWQSEGRKEDYKEVMIEAMKEVGRPAFFSLLVIAVSFVPIFALEAQEGRLFKPLAWTKNLSMAIAAFLAITLDPALRLMFSRFEPFSMRPRWWNALVNAVVVGKVRSEEKHPVSRVLHRLYGPAVDFVLRWPKAVIAASVVVVLTTIPVYFKLGKEFMPPLNEGTILYMPTTLPGISVEEALRLLQRQDEILASFPEVKRVHGKIGRANTSTDPAPFSMMETVVTLKDRAEWRKKEQWYSEWAPGWLKDAVLARIWPETLSWGELVNEMDEAMQFPGATNAWTMPIKARIDMLTTGVRTPVGVKIFGSDIGEIENLGEKIENVLRSVAGTRSVFAERTAGGYYLDFDLRRDAIARHGLVVDDVHMTVMGAVGGENVTTTVEGRERYPVNVRYPLELRSSVERLSRVLVATPSGAQIPLAQLADIRLSSGPAMVRNENGLLAGYVYVDFDTEAVDVGTYVARAKAAVEAKVRMPPGYALAWSGQYEAMERVRERLILVVPVTLLVIFVLLHLNTRSTFKTLLVFTTLSFSAAGAVWFLYALGYNLSVAVWVGIIALLGLDAEMSVFMLLYLDLACTEARKRGKLRSFAELKAAVHQGSVQRVRPKVMTVATTFMALLPLMWSTGTGADVMKRVAAPIVGGLFTSFLMELLVYPAVYLLWKWHTEVKNATMTAPSLSDEREKP